MCVLMAGHDCNLAMCAILCVYVHAVGAAMDASVTVRVCALMLAY